MYPISCLLRPPRDARFSVSKHPTDPPVLRMNLDHQLPRSQHLELAPHRSRAIVKPGERGGGGTGNPTPFPPRESSSCRGSVFKYSLLFFFFFFSHLFYLYQILIFNTKARCLFNFAPEQPTVVRFSELTTLRVKTTVASVFWLLTSWR